jgi:ABC-type enterochelin transport system substrate-binding protein
MKKGNSKMKRIVAMLLALMMILSLCACGKQEVAEVQTEAPQTTAAPETTAAPTEPAEITITDMIGREVTIVPGSYKRVVCIGAGALRMYSYIGDVSLLAGVEDIDNTTAAERPMMFDSVARPYVLAYGATFNTLPSCGVGGPMAQTAEAEKILSCNPDIVISEYEDVEKEDALQEQLGVPVITLKAGSKGVFDEAFSGSMALLGKVFGEEEKAADECGKANDAAIVHDKAFYAGLYKAAEDVAPFVGKISNPFAFDSAADIYKKALDKAGVVTDGIDPSAFGAMVSMLNKPAAIPQGVVEEDPLNKRLMGIKSN